MAAADAAVSSPSVGLFAELVEAESHRHAACAARPPAEADLLLRTFRGGVTPEESVGQFLDRIYRAGWVEVSCFMLAGIYLGRFLHSRAAIAARIHVEPATAHRLTAIALYVGNKFGGHPYKGWTSVFEVCSGYTIRAPEMITLERCFLQAIGYRLFVRSDEYNSFVWILVAGPPTRAPAPAPPAPELVPQVEGRRGGKRKVARYQLEDKHHRARRVRPCLPTTAGAAGPSVIESK